MKLSDLITENDGKSLCPVRIFGLLSAVQYLGLSGWTVWSTHAFDYVAFGGGASAMITAIGVAFAAKSFQEGHTDGGSQ